VAPLFERWLDEHFPERKAKVLSRIRAIRGGDRLSDPRWGTRIKGKEFSRNKSRPCFR